MNILTSEERSDYERDGFIIVRKLFSEDEINLLRQTARADNEMDKSSSSMDDGEGNAVRLALWNHPGDGIYGMIARCRKLVDRVEDLLDDEAYHYHSKMVLKTPRWVELGRHQDYGYWYQNGVLSLNLCSVMIAVDKAEENGYMQVLKGSHKLGRINHVLWATRLERTWNAWRKPRNGSNWFMRPWTPAMPCSFIRTLSMPRRPIIRIIPDGP